MKVSISLRNRLLQFLKSNASKKKVIIIDSYDKSSILAEAIKHTLDYFGTNTVILCFKLRVPEEFDGFKEKVMLSECYLNCEDYQKIDGYVFNNITKNWDIEIKSSHKNIFTYRGVELARIAEYDLHRFLLAKIKAIYVIDKAIKKENYKAAFIAGTNNELKHLDKLLYRQYGISTDYVEICEKNMFATLVRKKVSSFISELIDAFASLSIRNKKQAKLIDARLFFQLGLKNQKSFILTPLEEGSRLRLKCFFERNRGYAAFNFNSQMRTKEQNHYKKILNSLSLADKFVFEHVSYWELVEERVKSLIMIDFVRFRENIDILFRLHKKYNIGQVILRNDVKELEKTLVLTSKNLGIKTLVIQHGILAEYNGHNIISADKIAAWGNRSVRWYEKFGNDPHRIKIVGNPNLDNIFNYMNSNNNENFISSMGITKKRYLITFIAPNAGLVRASSFTTDDEIQITIKEILKAVESIGDTNLVVKLHPSDRIGVFKKLLKSKKKDIVAIVDKFDVRRLIKASDIVITKDSSIALEAVILKKPIIIINLSKRPDLVPYVEGNVALGAYKPDDIESAIRKIMHDEGIKRKMDLSREVFIKDNAYKIDGKIKDRILELIENL